MSAIRTALCGPDAPPERGNVKCQGETVDPPFTYHCTGGSHKYGENMICTHSCHDIGIKHGVFQTPAVPTKNIQAGDFISGGPGGNVIFGEDPNEHPAWCKCQRVCGGDQ